MEVKGYKYPTSEAATTALQQINTALGITSKQGVITSYTDFTEIQGDYYIIADARIESILGPAQIYVIEEESTAEDN